MNLWLSIGLALAAAAAIGALAAIAWLKPRLAAERLAAEILRRQLDAASGAQNQLADLRSHLSSLRHDLRGILSPALLVADRLVNHADPAVRKSGEVVLRTVERATARLAEAKPEGGVS